MQVTYHTLFCPNCWEFFAFRGRCVCTNCEEEVVGYEPVEISHSEWQQLRREEKRHERTGDVRQR